MSLVFGMGLAYLPVSRRLFRVIKQWFETQGWGGITSPGRWGLERPAYRLGVMSFGEGRIGMQDSNRLAAANKRKEVGGIRLLRRSLSIAAGWVWKI
jgi:hypothetical protein